MRRSGGAYARHDPAQGHAQSRGYSYALNHQAFDKDHDVQAEVRNAALTLWDAVKAKRSGVPNGTRRRESPRQK